LKLAKRLATITTATTAALLCGAGGAHAQGDGGLHSLLGSPSIVLACFPAGQVGQGNTFNGTQNVNCNQSATTTTTNPPTGNGGVTGYEVVTAGATASPGGADAHATVYCPEGKVATGGGFFVGTSTQWANESSWPVTADQNPEGLSGWQAEATNVGTELGGITVYAICVDAAQ
jgi:hypothetical protein